MVPKNPPIREAQIVWLRHRKRDRLPHRSVRPVRLVRCHISRSARFHPACRILNDCAGHNSDKSPIRRGHPVLSSSSKILSSQPTSVGRYLLREKIRQQTSNAEHRTLNIKFQREPLHSALGVRRWTFDVCCQRILDHDDEHEHEHDKQQLYNPRVRCL